MDKHRIRIFDTVRLDIALNGNLVHGLFVHFLGFALGDPHLTAFGAPNPSGKYRGLFTPHFTAWLGREFRRTLARISPAKLVAFFDAYKREAMKHYVAALEPVEPATLEREDWVFIEPDNDTFGGWISRNTVDGELVVDKRSVGELVNVMFSDAQHRAPTAYVPRPGAPVLAVRTKIDGRMPMLMQVVHFPDGCGIEHEDGTLELAHPEGWYILHDDWWPRDAQQRFFESWFGPKLARLTKIVEVVGRCLDFVGKHQPA